MSELFLEDTVQTFNYQLLNEAEHDGKFYIRGIVSRAGVFNKNKRIYPFDVMNEAIASVQEKVSTGGFVGELMHPSSPRVNLDKISHKITKLEMMEDGTVISEMVVLNTTKGKELQELMKGGVSLGVSTRATGGVKPYTGTLGEGVEVLPGLKMRAIDVVFDPSAGDDGRPDFVMEDINESYIEENGNKAQTIQSIVEDLF